jgi:hypothetical protein
MAMHQSEPAFLTATKREISISVFLSLVCFCSIYTRTASEFKPIAIGDCSPIAAGPNCA